MPYRLRKFWRWDSVLHQFGRGADFGPERFDPFEDRQVVFLAQSEMVKRWLELRLAERGWVFMPPWRYPGPLFGDLVRPHLQALGKRLIGDPGSSHLGRVAALELTLAALELEPHLGFAVARQTAALLVHYADNFPEILRAWASGAGEDHPVYRLWRHCTAKGWMLAGEVFDRSVEEGWDFGSDQLPTHILVVGAPFLSVTEQRFLVHLARWVEVDHFLLLHQKPHPLRETFLQQDLVIQLLEDPALGDWVYVEELDDEPPLPEVRLTSCWGPVREVETAVQDLLKVFSQEKTLSLEEVAILSPDWTPYRSALDMALSGNDRSLLGSPALPHRLEEEDISWREGRALLEGLVSLVAEGWTRSRVCQLVAHPWVPSLLGVAEVPDWERWCEECHFHWGWDLKGVRADSPQITHHASLQEAWERFVGTLGETTVVAVPTWSQFRAHSLVMSWLEDWRDLTAELGHDSTWAAWAKATLEFFERWPLVEQKDFEQALKEACRVMLDLDGIPCRATDWGQYLAQALTREGWDPQLLVAGLCLGSLNRLRGIPFDTIVVLGMGEDFPPQAEILRDDLLYTQETRWSALRERRDALSRPSLSMRLLLEALTQARRRLWITYSGGSPFRDEERPPSWLAELLFRLAHTHQSPRSTAFHGWEADDESTTVYAYYGRAAEALRRSAPPLEWEPPAPIAANLGPYRHPYFVCMKPLASFLKVQRGLDEPWALDQGGDREPWSLDFSTLLMETLSVWEREGPWDFTKVEIALASRLEERFHQGQLGRHPVLPPYSPKTRDRVRTILDALVRALKDILPTVERLSWRYDPLFRLGAAESEGAMVLVDFAQDTEIPYFSALRRALWLAWYEEGFPALTLGKETGISLIRLQSKGEPKLNHERMPSWTAGPSSPSAFFQQLASWYLSRPCLIPFHALRREAFSENPLPGWEALQRVFRHPGITGSGDPFDQSFQRSLVAVLQGRVLSPSCPPWFDHQWSEWWGQFGSKLMGLLHGG